jgi:hypothetical protein
MAIQRLQIKPRSPLSTEQKVAFGLLMFLGTGGIVFGFQSFGANMMRPIQAQFASYYQGETFLTTDERASKELEESKIKDTDQDGLVDYDELYVYKTSPYITDSDSDGFDDKQEVFSGNNPNCPSGKQCGIVSGSVDSPEAVSDESPADVFLSALADEGVVAAGDVEFTSEEDVREFFEQATIDQIRKALVEAGMTQEQLDQIDDETLQAILSGEIDGLTDEAGEEELQPVP